MKAYNDRITIKQILGYAKETVSFTEGKSKNDIESDRMLELALVRLLEMIGEAATRISEDMKTCHQEIPWKEMIRIRNRLIHGYDSIDIAIL